MSVFNELVELNQQLKEIYERDIALKIKINQLKALMGTLDGFISKNQNALKNSRIKLKEEMASEIINLPEIKRLKEVIETASILRETHQIKKAEYITGIESSRKEIKLLKEFAVKIENRIQELDCKILDFSNEKKQNASRRKNKKDK